MEPVPATKPDVNQSTQVTATSKILQHPTITSNTVPVPWEPTRTPPLTNDAPKPAATPDHLTPTPVEATEKPAQDVTKAPSTTVTAPPARQPQVTFQPGTKGTTDDTKAQVATSPNPPQQDSNTSIAKPSPLPIKPPTEGPRPADALSSPGSTAQSATTPAVHDASTDTSIENEGSRVAEPVEQKPTEDKSESKPIEQDQASRVSSPEDIQKRVLDAPADSAEAQLLQESIRSSASAATRASKPTGGAPDTTGDSTTSGTDKVTAPGPAPNDEASAMVEDAATQQDAKNDKQVSLETQNTGASHVKEIPDSQEEVPDRMDVDTPEPLADMQTQTQSVPAAEKPIPVDDTPSTPLPDNTSPSETPQLVERAVTRTSSGTIRPKSVSEIVGDTPRQTPTLEQAALRKSFESQLTPVTSTPKSPNLRLRNINSHRRQRSRSQPSTVVFGKQPKRVDDKTLVPSLKDTIQPTDDYYTPLFVQGFAGSSSWMQSIEKILYTANKTITTPDANLAIQDHQACKVLRRVYHLQQHDKWALRQPKRCPEPTRPASHWDVMLQEMKWMRTDFREERKWKRAIAKNLAYACAEWHEATPEERKLLQAPAIIPEKPQPADLSMLDIDEDGIENQPTPDLVPSGDMASPLHSDGLTEDFAVETIAPSEIFTLQEDDVVFGLRRTAAADQLLEELPMYGAPLKVPKFDLTGPEYDPDARWRRPALPLSKYVEGHMKLVSDGPPRKRSRFSYRNEDSEDEDESVFANSDTSSGAPVPPTTSEVALFNPEMKHIRDRLHAGHQFRPPSEHVMPTQSFYESRSPSQWTLSEDDELRSLVREHSYNWSLISSLLSTKSLFTSGAERRTPWECFERWINLEGLPADMQKTQYFKAYNSRIEAAQRVIMQQNQISAQQANASGGAVAAVRRRPSVPLRVERRRNQKHLTLIDAMRKLAKKRETTVQKQQHTASQNAANKKTNDPISQRPTKTPRDYSLLRWERDQALAEKMAQYAQRQEAQRRVSYIKTMTSFNVKRC